MIQEKSGKLVRDVTLPPLARLQTIEKGELVSRGVQGYQVQVFVYQLQTR